MRGSEKSSQFDPRRVKIDLCIIPKWLQFSTNTWFTLYIVIFLQSFIEIHTLLIMEPNWPKTGQNDDMCQNDEKWLLQLYSASLN